MSYPTPTPTSLYSMVVSSTHAPPVPTPTLSTIINSNAIFSNPRILLYALSQEPRSFSTAPQAALGQSTMSAQTHIASPIIAPSPAFNTHLYLADMEFLKQKLTDCQERQKNTLLSEGQSNHYIKIVATLEQALREGSAIELTKPMQTQLQTDPDRRTSSTTRRKEVVVSSRLLNLLSTTASAGSTVLATVPSTVPSTNPINVFISPPLPTLSAQSSEALPTGSPGALALQLETAEDDQFANEMRSTSSVGMITTGSATAGVKSEPSKQTSEMTIPLEAKEVKRRGRPRKDQKEYGGSNQEKDSATRCRDDRSYIGEGEGNGKADSAKRSGSRNGNRKQTHGRDREPTQAGTSRSRSPKGQHSCTSAIGRKPPMVKSFVRRGEPLT